MQTSRGLRGDPGLSIKEEMPLPAKGMEGGSLIKLSASHVRSSVIHWAQLQACSRGNWIIPHPLHPLQMSVYIFFSYLHLSICWNIVKGIAPIDLLKLPAKTCWADHSHFLCTSGGVKRCCNWMSVLWSCGIIVHLRKVSIIKFIH